MSHTLKNLNQKYYIALGIGIALIFLIIDFIPDIFHGFYLFIIIRFAGVIVTSFLLIIALVKILSKTFTTYIYKTIIWLLVGAIIVTLISLLFDYDFLKIIVMVVCVVVVGFTLTIKKKEEAKPHEEISPHLKIAQHESNILLIKFVAGGGLIVIGILGALIMLSGLGGLGVSNLNNFSGYLLLLILVGPPIIVFIVPGYFLVRSGYRQYDRSKH